jgi:hypothetical protein
LVLLLLLLLLSFATRLLLFSLPSFPVLVVLLLCFPIS